MNKYSTHEKKSCKKCKKNFIADSNNQRFCHTCRPRHFVVGAIRPPKSKEDAILDQLDFQRSRLKAKGGWY